MTNGLDCRRAVMVWCSDMTVTWWQCLETSITDTVTSWVSQLCHYSHVPEYVYLMLRYLLTECVDDDQYNAVENDGQKCLSNIYNILDVNYIHGPAVVTSNIAMQLPADLVRCVRCLTWPQAADWSTRHRNYGGPDSLLIILSARDVMWLGQCIVSVDNVNGWTSVSGDSFSRAEIVLINSWMPVQQIVYHMLRIFFKTPKLSHIDNL